MRGGGDVIILAAFSSAGKSSIEFIDGKIDSVRYDEMLKNDLESFIEDKHDYDCWFQKENARPHVVDHTKEYFTALRVPVTE